MNATENQRARARRERDTTQGKRSVRKAKAAVRSARLIQASACGLIGAALWALPAAQAVSQEAAQPGQAPLPMTMAANGGAVHLTIGMSGAAPAAASGATQGGRGPNCTGTIADHQSVTIPVGKSTMVNIRESVKTRTVGNPSIVQAMLVSPQTLYLLGTDVGTTNMIVQGRSGSCTIIDVAVGADPGGLQQTLAVLMPEESGVQIKAAADTLVLTGTVSDSVKAERIVELARAYVSRQAAPVPVAANAGGAQGGAMIPAVMKTAGPSGNGNNERIVNMMHVAAPQQVMLEVKVAEVSKTLIDQLGMAANIQGSSGSWTFGLLADFLSGGLGAIAGSKANTNPLKIAFDAQKTDQLVKVLAEPNLMAISGQEASFLAGGKVFIPVPQSNGAAGSTIILQEETFGVGLTFTPTVLDNGRINLKVSPEVSELSPTGVAVTAGTVSTTAVLPLITTRRASTTLQVYDGQSFAIGGLMKSNVTGTLKGLPGLGEVPVLGALFRSTSFQEDKTELVFVVTPRLAKPLPQNYPLPTDHFGKVTEAAVYFTGNMEGKKPQPPVEPVPPSTGAAIPSPIPVKGGAIATTGTAAPVVLTPVITSQGTTTPTPVPAPERTQPVSDAIRAPATPRAPDGSNGGDGSNGLAPITRIDPPDGSVHAAAVPTASVSAQSIEPDNAAANPTRPATQQAREGNEDRRTQ